MSYESFIEDGTQGSMVVAPETLAGETGAESHEWSPSGWGKRTLDLVIATSLLVFLLPVLLIVAVMVRGSDKGPAIFSQLRRGRNGKMFACYKFRTMVPDAAEQLVVLLETDPELAAEWQRDQKLRNDPRITRFGRVLRKSSIDELPQLINIIRGEMSVVGPRPIVDNEVQRYADHIVAYDFVRPGVTGLWQVSGRNNTTYDERVELDTRYAETYSFWGDIKILFKTIPTILFSRGAF